VRSNRRSYYRKVAAGCSGILLRSSDNRLGELRVPAISSVLQQLPTTLAVVARWANAPSGQIVNNNLLLPPQLDEGRVIWQVLGGSATCRQFAYEITCSTRSHA